MSITSPTLFDYDSGYTTTALFSECRRYRYTLWRIWDTGLPPCVFVCLNPSTADETKDDPTVRRCINYARDWGYGSFCMMNIFAYRATDPRDMKACPVPIGPENDKEICVAAMNAAMRNGIVVCAWGTHGSHLDREGQVKKMLRPFKDAVHYLRLSKDGHPCHPLYLPKNLLPKPFDLGVKELSIGCQPLHRHGS